MLSESFASQLSQELIDLIIDHVAEDSAEQPRDDLLQCALVSRSFRPRSQRHIFSSIDLGPDSSSSATRTRDMIISELLDIIHDNLYIANYIEELSLECTNCQYSWIYENQAFLDVMKTISKSERCLRKFTLQINRWDLEGLEAYSLDNPEPLRDKFFLPFIAPFITSLSIRRLSNLPIELVTSCVNLVDLELLHVELREYDTAKTCGPHVIRLRSLKHRLSRAALDKLRAPPSDGSVSALELSYLQSFTVHIDDLPDLASEQTIINAACKSLEEIYVLTMETHRKSFCQKGQVLSTEVLSGSTECHSSLNLGACTRLRQLHAHVLFPEHGLVSIRQTLSTVKSGLLKDIFIDARVGFWEDATPEVVFDADWAAFCLEVARVMVQDEPRFEFKLTYLYYDGTFSSTWNAEMQTRLDEQCRLVLDKLRNDRLGLLQGPRFTVTLSYELRYDSW